MAKKRKKILGSFYGETIMKIGIDISALQTGHRMRGIGSTIINIINNIPNTKYSNYSFVFFVNKKIDINPLDYLEITGLEYETRFYSTPQAKNIGGIKSRITNLLNSEKRILFGRKIDTGSDIDIFIQPEQNGPLPKSSEVKSVLIIYDAIPYVMEDDYLWGYRTARSNGCSIKGSFRHAILRSQYARLQKSNCKRANKIIAISEKTKDDFVDFFGIKKDKINICSLGINQENKIIDKNQQIYAQKLTCWGYKRKPIDLKDKKFLLYVGGADPRRKINELIAAFNNLRAQGEDIYLVLAGDSFFGVETTPHLIQKYLLGSSYNDRIFFLGFISDKERDWLYANALAFVYPSVYEGFGLPILEAMCYKCPVITYSTPSIVEIAGKTVSYAEPNNYLGIMNAVKNIQNINNKSQDTEKAFQKSINFTWTSSTSKLISICLDN